MALALIPAAAPASGEDVLRDCAEDGTLDRRYSSSEYREAQREMPADLEEYSDCRAVIRRAQLAAAGAGRRGGDGTGSPVAGRDAGGPGAPAVALTPQEQAAVADVIEDGGEDSITVGREDVTPGEAAVLRSASADSLPTPLIVALALLAAFALAFAAVRLRERRSAR